MNFIGQGTATKRRTDRLERFFDRHEMSGTQVVKAPLTCSSGKFPVDEPAQDIADVEAPRGKPRGVEGAGSPTGRSAIFAGYRQILPAGRDMCAANLLNPRRMALGTAIATARDDAASGRRVGAVRPAHRGGDLPWVCSMQ
jgi:hypothetical protein